MAPARQARNKRGRSRLAGQPPHVIAWVQTGKRRWEVTPEDYVKSVMKVLGRLPVADEWADTTLLRRVLWEKMDEEKRREIEGWNTLIGRDES